ncbi:MAG: ABC transporter ATP-binding protein [Bacteroidales bacterium]|nr:ABC transporter ATP-binding protein [Bacteroidales bacterium]
MSASSKMSPGGGRMRGGVREPHMSRADLKKSLGKDSTVWRLFRLIFKNYKIRFGVVLVCIVISALTTLASSLFTRSLIDDYITPMLSQASPDFSPLALALIKLAAVLLLGVAASYSYNLIMIFVGQGTMLKLRQNLFAHMEDLPLSYFDSHSHGDVMSVYTNDVDTLRQVIGNTVPNLFQSLITLVSTFVSMLVLSLPLTLVSICMATLTVWVTGKLGNISRGYFVQRQQALGAVNGFIEEMVSGQRVVKVYCHEKKAVEDFAALNEKLRSSAYNANKIGSMVMPINGNIGNLGYVLTAVIGALIALGGLTAWYLSGVGGAALTLGTLVAFLSLQKNFTRPISSISNEINSIAMASAGTDRVYSLLDEPKEVDNGNVTLVNTNVSQDGNLAVSDSRTGTWAWIASAGPDRSLSGVEGPSEESGQSEPASADKELVPLQGLVSLKDVDFSYVEGKQVLFDISLTAYPGQKIAFVGGTGAGKTTITNLINRFYEIQEGTITYDGFDVRDIQKDSLRRSLGIVLQETCLFSASVLDNIRYGRLDATDEECRAAARLVYADSFIRRLPQGYDTILSADGGNLSQGERQLLAIARAAVADPPVLILDEATSSIDTRTEKLIQKGMDSLMKGRTTFVIAHRLSTVQNANYIMVLDHGKIIERGRHDELLALKGKYYELYTGNQITA